MAKLGVSLHLKSAQKIAGNYLPVVDKSSKQKDTKLILSVLLKIAILKTISGLFGEQTYLCSISKVSRI
jgi:hypothetical protein